MNTSTSFFSWQAFAPPVPVTPDKNDDIEPVCYDKAANPMDTDVEIVVPKDGDTPHVREPFKMTEETQHLQDGDDQQDDDDDDDKGYQYHEYEMFPKADAVGIGDTPVYILNKLGEGVYGRVFRSVRLNKRNMQHEPAALKIVSANKQEIRYEAQVLQALNHENIIKCYETLVDVPNRRLGIVMELCAMNLKERHEKRALTISELRPIATGIAKALEYCHAVGYAHMDLKPENVMISSKGETKLCDFGYARPNGTTQESLGTPNYFAPELIPGRDSETTLADMWSFGALLMELVPFLGFKHDWTNAYRLYNDPEDIARNAFRTGLSRSCRELREKHKDEDNMSFEEKACLMFVRQTVRMKPTSRLTAQDAVAHYWLHDYSSD